MKGLVVVVLDSILMTVLIICLYTDLRFKKIYNAVLLPAALTALIGNIYIGGVAGGLNSVKGLALGMALLFIPFALGGIGGGDVKLLGIVGAFKGPGFVWAAFLAAAITGGLISLIIMVKNRNFSIRIKSIAWAILSILRIIPPVDMLDNIQSASALTFPYGVAIAAGTVLAYLSR